MEYDSNFNPRLTNTMVFENLEKEQNEIGYYNLAFQDTSEIKKYAKTVKQKYIAIIGTGGSTLGTYAIYNFLKRTQKYDKTIYFFESTDPIDINSRLEKFDLEDTLFVVISKSGTTIETLSLFKYFHSLVKIDKNNCVILTEHDSKLNVYAKHHNIQTFDIDKNVGGRFSVFSCVGLVPLSIVGVDIDSLLKGCQSINKSYFSKGESYDLIMKKARFMAENKHKFNINVIFSYSIELEGFNKWYVQLWAESLGKKDNNNTHQGLTPIGLLGPVDQHSFLQLIMEGKRDKTVTFIKVDDYENKTKIVATKLHGLEEFDYINDLAFSELLNNQADATIKAVQDLKTIPCDLITLNKINEYNLASLMYSYELLTSAIGQFLVINAYNQPGVESGKINLKNKLKKLKDKI